MKQNVALVLSSGGSRGLAHIGVINELVKHFHRSSYRRTLRHAQTTGIYLVGKLF
ncbi:MAG: hypothetical protein PWP52_582 [Bacteroidales bacterium]|nr:hypothetical protein [Bacteroidales bacterium]